MLNDLMRVGPSQGTTANDLDLGIDKLLNHDMKHDFEKELRAVKAKDEKPEKLESKIDKPLKDLDQVTKKSSGGIKKKMTKANDDESDVEQPEADVKLATNVVKQEANDKTISKVMVSQEGEVEIADDDKNLQNVSSEQQAHILNLQAQMFAAQPAVDPALAPSPEMTTTSQTAEAVPSTQGLQQPVQQQFQHLSDAEQAVLTEMNASEMPAAEMPTTIQPTVELSQSQLTAQSLSEQQMQGELQTEEQQQPAQDVLAAKASKEEKPSALESKVYDILSKESAQTAEVPHLKQDAQVKTDSSLQALNQTNAVLAQSNAEQEQSMNSDQQKHDSSSDQGQSKQLPKLESHHDLASQVSALHTQQRSFQNHLGAATAAATAAANRGDADALKDANVKEIMNQAKFLVTKGGGEMTVKMTPEGMGEVQLKVALDNGKINIEMNSQDKAVKKMIEESLSDLKSSLASHQMRVEHVKINNVAAVDTNNQAGTQSDLNNSNSHQNRQQHEMNFQNMANSNSGRQGREQSSSHSGSHQPMMQAGVQTSAKTSAGRAAYTAANKGSSVNMVA